MIGAIDLNRANLAAIATTVPLTNAPAKPFLFRLIEHLHKVLDGATRSELPNSFAPFRFVGPASPR